MSKSRPQAARGSAGDLMIAYVAKHAKRLGAQEARLRDEAPGSVHKARVAARRLRSALKSYRPLLTDGSTESIGEDLRWFGQALGRARDAQVMRERLRLHLAAEPHDLVVGEVARRIDEDLQSEQRIGWAETLAALGDARFPRMLAALDDLVRDPSLTAEAGAPAVDVLPVLLARDLRGLRKAVGRIARADTRHAHDEALHEVRKKAKRLRYCAESALPALGVRARELAGSAKEIQEALGEHQDSVVARAKLWEYAATGDNGFTFGRLHALEQVRGGRGAAQVRVRLAAPG